jgi:16S rRNA (adenine1518-N6/adenine1519-N6)-dimethyltransferase
MRVSHAGGRRANLTQGEPAGRRRGGKPELRKALGQHHLRDGSLCRPLLEFLEPLRDARVVEVGPGGGVLTAELLARGARVLGWELDLAWAAALRRRWQASALALVAGDALALPWGRLPAPTIVAGNLPYAIATALVERLLPYQDRIPRASFLVQKEVAERLVARPGDAAYGALSILTAARAAARVLGVVHPRAFRPPPKVDSAFVGFVLHPPPLPEAEMPAFTGLVRAAFAQRRKTLRNSLGARLGIPAAEALLAACGFDTRIRAERLGLEDFLALHRAALETRLAIA